MKEMNLDDNSDNLVQTLTNGDSEKISTSRFSSLLASKDRDYLLSSTEAEADQVSFLFLSLAFSFYGRNISSIPWVSASCTTWFIHGLFSSLLSICSLYLQYLIFQCKFSCGSEMKACTHFWPNSLMASGFTAIIFCQTFLLSRSSQIDYFFSIFSFLLFCSSYVPKAKISYGNYIQLPGRRTF